MANKSLARKHGVKAMRGKVLSSANLQHCVSLRNRMGLELAFLEDPLLQGILAAKTTKGMAARIRAQALEDLKQEAKKNKADGKQQEAVRQLIGPRGGLPVLKADLVKLACLVNVEVGQDDTVEKLRAKVKPLVDAIALKPAPKSAPAKAKALPSSAPADHSAEVLTVGTLEQSGACGKDGHGRSSSVDARTRSSFSGHDDSSHAVFHRHAGWNWQHDRSAPVREPSDATRSTATRRTSRCSDGTTDAHGGGTLGDQRPPSEGAGGGKFHRHSWKPAWGRFGFGEAQSGRSLNDSALDSPPERWTSNQVRLKSTGLGFAPLDFRGDRKSQAAGD